MARTGPSHPPRLRLVGESEIARQLFAVATSIATYVTRFVPHVEALEQVESLLRRRAHDSYSRRSLLVEAAVQRALRGRSSQASVTREPRGTGPGESQRDAITYL